MNATVHPCPRAGSALWVFLAVVTVALVILFLVFGATTVSTRVVLTGGMPATASVQPWTPEQIAADPNGYMTWALA